MKFGGRALVTALSGMVLSTGAGAAATDAEATFPYHGIAERNVFNLKDPPPPPTNAPPPVAVPNITLTMITTIFGDKRVGLKWPGTPKPGQPPIEESHILVVGQAEAGVEVLDADEVEGTVKVNNHGTPQTLNFTSNGAKPTAAPPAYPGAPPPAVPGAPIPGAGGAVVNPNANPALRTIPQRTLRVPNAPGQAATGPNPQGSVIAAPNQQAFVMGSGGPVGASVNPEQPQLTPEQQALLIEKQREIYQKQGDVRASLLPPTALTPRTIPPPTQNQSP